MTSWSSTRKHVHAHQSPSRWVACSSSGSQVARHLPGHHSSVTASPLRYRTRVHYIWRPHYVPQASNNVCAAAVTLLYIGSIRQRTVSCRPTAHYCARNASSQGWRATESRGDNVQYLLGHWRSVPTCAWQESQKLNIPQDLRNLTPM